jgi:hydrogenase maturation factor
MLNVTESALDRMSERLARQNAAEDVALRFARRDAHWKLVQDQERPGDVTFAHTGRNVLLLDKSAAKAMANMTLDVRDTAAGPRLRLSRAAKQNK